MKIKHTATPWKINELGSSIVGKDFDGEYVRLLDIPDSDSPLQQTEAKFIILAVNSHEKMLEALKDIEYKLVKGFRYVKEIDPSARINFADALSLVTQIRLQVGEE